VIIESYITSVIKLIMMTALAGNIPLEISGRSEVYKGRVPIERLYMHCQVAT
jgi:hypothetical protein